MTMNRHSVVLPDGCVHICICSTLVKILFFTAVSNCFKPTENIELMSCLLEHLRCANVHPDLAEAAGH